MSGYLKETTDSNKTMAIPFAIDKSSTLKDLQSRTTGKVKTFKAIKIPQRKLDRDVLARIEGKMN